MNMDLGVYASRPRLPFIQVNLSQVTCGFTTMRNDSSLATLLWRYALKARFHLPLITDDCFS